MIMVDVLTRIENSVVQHGPESDRVYGMKLATEDMPGILDRLDALAREEGYGKLFVKTRRAYYDDLIERGYMQEAMVPLFYGPEEDGLFMGKFLDPERARENRPERVQEVLRVAGEERLLVGPEGEPGEAETREADGKGADTEASTVPKPGLLVREATPGDTEALAACYRNVFDSYPFPIHDPAHLRGEQEAGTRFFAVWEEDTLVAASSMEPGGAPGTVEMTDFATLPSQRGKGLATYLLALMDRKAEEAGERVAYTIARAVSFGMNITFARRGYNFGGTLVNNTQISGAIESMNVWYKIF